jgi:chromosome segregation ATPase
LKTNAFKAKVTFIPMDQIQVKVLEPDLVDYYHRMSEGRARIAIELIDFDPKYTRVMQFAFGNAFVTEDKVVAKQISGGKGGKRPVNCITLDGDNYNFMGTMSGGYNES